jgi:GTP-binding protein
MSTTKINSKSKNSSKSDNTLNFQSAKFEFGAMNTQQFPKTRLPEIALIGRSNVGKSSLLNSLTNNSKLAKVSKTPGRTRQINFFNISDKIYLVDLPGYGYAKISHNDRHVWDQLISDYIYNRSTLRKAFVLLDFGLPIKNTDKQVLDILDNIGLEYQLILTKCDKVRNKELAKEQLEYFQNLAKEHRACYPTPILSSNKDRKGVDEVKKILISIAKR